jgi:hypothetical protein
MLPYSKGCSGEGVGEKEWWNPVTAVFEVPWRSLE